MSHMDRLLCSALLLFLLCCAYGCAASAVVQPLPQKGQAALDAYTVAVVDSKKQGNWEPLRIRVFPLGVYIWIKECPKLRVTTWGPAIPPFCYGGARITMERAKMIHGVVVEAAKLHMVRLRVQRVKERWMRLNIKSLDHLKEICPGILVPTEHLKKGVENADFALYVSLALSHEHARICTKNNQKRPISALIKVNPQEIKHTRHYVRRVAHDIGHGLGFMVPVFMEHNMLKKGGAKSGRGVRFLETKAVAEKAREHYGCPRLFDMELDVRDEGVFRYIWVAYPHWKRRYAKDELMSVYLDRPSGMYYTALTLAAFHSMPFYEADFSKAETMPFGKNAGCKFVQGKCIEKDLPINPDMFCVDESKKLRCTTDRRSLGKCSIVSLFWKIIPSEFYYFSNRKAGSPYEDWMDYCPVIEPTFDTSCELGKEDKMPGSLVSRTSVCLDVKSPVLRNGKDNDKVEGICAKVKCEGGILKVQYKGNNDWHNCKDGDFIDNLNGDVFSGGSLVCPNYTDFCGPKPVPKPPKPAPPKPAPESKPATGTSMGPTDGSTSTASNVQTDTRLNGTETHDEHQEQEGHESEKQQDGAQVPEVPVHEEHPVPTGTRTNETGVHEEHQVPEKHDKLGFEEHSDSGNDDTVGTNPEDFDNEYMEDEGKSVVEAMLNDTVNSKGRSGASNGQQGVSDGSKGAGGQRRSPPDAHGTAGSSSGDHGSAGMRANGHSTGDTVVLFPEAGIGHVLNDTGIMNVKGIDSSIAASSIASLALLVCGVAALVTA